MRKLRFMSATALAIFAAVAPIASVAGGGVAEAQAPSPGDSCTVLDATTQDAYGRTMWCNPTMTGNHSLVWQYGGPS
jgi:poly(3-hydroxybutyrate) depolymerase